MYQVVQFFTQLFSAEGFPPRWFCGAWTPFHGWLYILANLGIWSAYFTIPLALVYIVRKRTDLPFVKLFWLFAAFILTCGITHFLDALMFWWPAYRLTGLMETITAIVSWATVFAILPVIPQVLLLKSPTQLEQDIQERTEALQESEMRFRLLTEGVQDYAIYMEDPQGLITSWNDGAERIFGYKAEEVIGQSACLFFTGEEIQNNQLQYELEAALASGRIELEAQRIRKGGERFWANILLTAVYDQQGKHIGFSKISRDITEKKQIESELQNVKNRLNRVIEGTDEGFWDWDVAKNQLFWSDRLYDMLGIERITGPFDYSTFEAFLPEEEKVSVRRAMDKTFEQGHSFLQEFRMRHSSGAYLYVYSRGKPEFDDHGNLIHVSGMVANITARKQAELALEEANAQLAQSNHDLEQFTAIASHDLKAPLRKVNIFSAIVEEEKDKLSSEGQDALSRLRSSIDSMLTLIDDLLIWSRATHAKPVIQPVHLDNVLKRTLTVLKPIIDEKNAEIHLKNMSMVCGDDIQLEQLFQNLIENALKYQPEGQKPIIEIETLRFDHLFWQINVQDNGIGFKPEYKDRIFEPFSRLHGRSSVYPGSGVGLAICKRIVERQGGTIDVQSEEGKGSLFIIRLPYPTEIAPVPVEGQTNALSM